DREVRGHGERAGLDRRRVVRRAQGRAAPLEAADRGDLPEAPGAIRAAPEGRGGADPGPRRRRGLDAPVQAPIQDDQRMGGLPLERAEPTPAERQPRALYVLFFAELWERFSFYGMQALLMLYMTKHLRFDAALAASLTGWYTGLVYLTPLFGG